jgi:hypothetical protein
MFNRASTKDGQGERETAHVLDWADWGVFFKETVALGSGDIYSSAGALSLAQL